MTVCRGYVRIGIEILLLGSALESLVESFRKIPSYVEAQPLLYLIELSFIKVVSAKMFAIARFTHCSDRDKWWWFLGLHAGKFTIIHNCSS